MLGVLERLVLQFASVVEVVDIVVHSGIHKDKMQNAIAHVVQNADTERDSSGIHRRPQFSKLSATFFRGN